MLDFKDTELKMLEFWDKNKIYDKIKKKNKSKKPFYFLQGPPYTSGKIHIGHAWNNSLKDLIMRYKRMKGFDVWDRAGYDMHGLPTENAVQKKLGLKTKEEIEKYGVDKFVKECMNFSVEHIGYMNNDLKRLGIWMDLENPYMPIKKEFISGQWAFFKKAHEQKRLYVGTKVMHWDSETETALAKHELEYKTIKDKSIFLKFKRKNKKNEYFLIWTTTPWTIPFNLAIMVNPDIDYVKMKIDDENWIISKDLSGVFMNSVVGKKYKIIEEFKGSELEGEGYEHFLTHEMNGKYEELKKEFKNIHTIILNKQYVDTTAGTGLVHCAPGCGPEDEEAAEPYGIIGYNSLNERGEFSDDNKFKGWIAKVDDNKFIDYFKEKGNLIAETKVEHEYPHSWRSHNPVVFRITKQWFLKTKDLIPRLVEFNKKVLWVPKKSGESYERWTQNLKENSVTRQRYWGCPVPIWVNKKNEDDFIVIESVEELEKLTGKKFDDLSLHKPWIDKIIIKKQGKEYQRIEDVCDVWIDSGTASWNCLYDDPKLIKRYFPADLVLEATEQTRLWFSLLQICSAVMFNKSCYKNVYTHGMILDFQGIKMSKSLGNIISPYEVVDKYSSDIFRYYICEITSGENINFNWEDIKQKQRNLVVLMNITNYIKDLIKLNSFKRFNPNLNKKSKKKGIEERYILSRTNSTIKKVTEYLENYNLDQSITEIERLFLEVSRIYIKMTRDKTNNDGERDVVLNTLNEVYTDCLKLFSIVCPLITESLWQELKPLMKLEESVHLTDWPKVNSKLIDRKLEENFGLVLQIIEKGLSERDKSGIGLKWPLAEATIFTNDKLDDELKEIIKNQLNVKEIKIKKDKEIKVELNTKLTKELEAEGYAREISRKVQAARKNAGLVKTDLIKLSIDADKELSKLIYKTKDIIKERTNAIEVNISSKNSLNYSHKFEDKIKDKKIIIYFEKS